MREDYITYDYISINVKSNLEHMYIDCLKNFGWMYINSGKKDYYINSNPYQDMVNIKFKRSRNIKRKDELKKLQEKCEKSILKIDRLEQIPHSFASMYSLIIAFVGIIFITIAALAIIGEKIIWLLAIFSGVIGIIAWILPYFVYKNVKSKKEEECKIKIEVEQDNIYDTCKRAVELLLEQ